MDHRNDVNNVQNKTETTLLRLVVSLQNYKERAFFYVMASLWFLI